MIIKKPIQIKTLPDEMYLENQVNEFKGNGNDDPFNGVCFPYDPRYVVNVKLCDSELEIRNEEYVAKVCQKYDLEYIQNDGVYGEKGINTISDDLISAQKEISARMPTSEIRWFGEPDNCFAFSFNSWEELKL